MTETRQGRLYLLRGPSGCGKSSIAHTIAQIFRQQNRLGAAVFLDGGVNQKVNSHVGVRAVPIQHLAVTLRWHYGRGSAVTVP